MYKNDGHGWELNLLGHWQLRLDGVPIDVGIRQQRLIAALALFGPRSRHFLAGLLWPDSTSAQAAGSLRASFFNVTHQQPNLLGSSNDSLFLDPGAAVDLHRLRRLFADIENSAADPTPDATEVLRTAELLPGWYEDWVLFEQERLQQQRLESLETLARDFLMIGDVGRAIDAAQVAAAIEPLRESVHLLLLRGHLEAGNTATALRTYQTFRDRLRRELGVAPSRRFTELLDRTACAENP